MRCAIVNLLLLLLFLHGTSAIFTTTPLSTPRSNLKSAAAGTRVVFVGGKESATRYLRCLANDKHIVSHRLSPNDRPSGAIDFYDSHLNWSYNLTSSMPYLGHAVGGALDAGGNAIFGILGASDPSDPGGKIITFFSAGPGVSPSISVHPSFNLTVKRCCMGAGGADYIDNGQGGVIVFAGGIANSTYLNDILICNVSDPNTPYICDSSAALTTPVSEPRVAVWRNIIVISGGLLSDGISASNNVTVGRFVNGNWIFNELTMVKSRAAHFMGIQVHPQDPSQAKVVIAGGYSGNSIFSTIEFFVIDTGGIVTQPAQLTDKLASPRRDLEGGCGSRTCAMMGGVNSTGGVSSDLDILDENKNVTTKAIPEGRSAFAAALTRPNDVILFGGGYVDSGGPSGSAVSNRVFALGGIQRLNATSLSIGRSDFVAVGFEPGRPFVMFAGVLRSYPQTLQYTSLTLRSVGAGGGCTPTNAVDIFNATTLTMSAGPPLSVARSHLAGAAASRFIVIAGGLGSETVAAMNTVDVYLAEPLTLITTSLRLSIARSEMAAAATPRYVMFAGGYDATGAVSSAVDVFDCAVNPPVQRINAGLALNPPRAYAAAIANQNGNLVLVAGGLTSSTTVTGASDGLNLTSPGNKFNVNTIGFGLSLDRAGIVAQYPGTYVAVFGGGFVPAAIGKRRACVNFFLLTRISGTSLYSPVPNAEIFDPPNLQTATLYASYMNHAGASSTAVTTFAGGRAFSGSEGLNSAISVFDTGHFAQNALAVPREFLAGASVGYLLLYAGGMCGYTYDFCTIGSRSRWHFFVKPTSFPYARGKTNYCNSNASGARDSIVEVFASGPRLFPGAGCLGAPPVAGAVCINGSWVISGNSVSRNTIITTGQQIEIPGILTLLPDGVTVISIDPLAPSVPINVTGTLILDGTLTLVLLDVAIDGAVITIATGSGEINGSFSQINVSSPESCQLITATPVLSSTSYAVLLNVDDSGCSGSSKGLSRGAIAGIVLGSVIFLALIIAVILLLLKKFSPNASIFRRQRRTRAQHMQGSELYS